MFCYRRNSKTKGRKNAIISLGFNSISNSYYERKKKNDVQEGNTPMFIPLSEKEQQEIGDIFE